MLHRSLLSRFTMAASVLSLAFCASPVLHADTLYWNGVGTADAGGGTGTWNATNTNWKPSPTGGSAVAWTNDPPDSAVFGVTGGTVTLGEARSAAGITFTTGGYVLRNTSANILTIGSGGITQTSGAGSTNQIGAGFINTGFVTLSASQAWLNQSSQILFQRDGNLVLGAHTLTFTSTGTGAINAAGVTTGTGSIVVSANTTASMSGNNGYSGTTTINSGATLTINSFGNFNAASGVGTKVSNLASNLVLNGGTLRVQVNSATSDRLFTVGAGGATLESRLMGGNSGQILLTNTAALAYAGVGNRTLTIGGNSDDTGGSSIALAIADVGGGNGTVAIAKTDAHSWTVSGTNTYTGGTTVSAGSLTMGSATALGSTSGQLTVNGGTLNMAALNLTVGNLTGTGGTISGTSAARTLTIGQGNGTGGDFEGVIANGAGGTTALTKTGTGTITLSGNNTYTGATAVNAGTLIIGTGGSLASGSAVTVDASGTLGGTGTVGGATTINGTHTPGMSPGIQAFATGLTYGASSTLVWELIDNTTASRGTNYDGVNVTGGSFVLTSGAEIDLAFSGSVDFLDTFWDSNQQWLVVDLQGGAFAADTNLFSIGNISGGSNYSPTLGTFGVARQPGTNADAVYLTWVAVPEPGTFALLAGACGLALAALRRRRA